MSVWLETLAALSGQGHPLDGDIASQILNTLLFEVPDVESFPEDAFYREGINIVEQKPVE